MSVNSSSSAQNELMGYFTPFSMRNTILGYLPNTFINVPKTFSILESRLRANFSTFIIDFAGEIIGISYNRYGISRSADISDQKVKFHVRFSKILIGSQNRSTHVNCVQSTAPNSLWARRTVRIKNPVFLVQKNRILKN